MRGRKMLVVLDLEPHGVWCELSRNVSDWVKANVLIFLDSSSLSFQKYKMITCTDRWVGRWLGR